MERDRYSIYEIADDLVEQIPNEQQVLPSSGKVKGTVIMYQEFPNAQMEVDMGAMIGEGGGGNIFEGILRNKDKSKKVCVKFFKIPQLTFKYMHRLIIDYSCTHLPHEHILHSNGVFCGENLMVGTVMEFVDGGNLEKFVSRITVDDKFRYAIQIASGMQFLHQVGVIHNDLRLENVLLDTKKNSVKISDFNNSLNEFFFEKLTPTLPEVRPDDNIYVRQHKKRDSYAFGLLLLHLFSGKKPTLEEKPSEIFADLRKNSLQTDRFEALWKLIARCCNRRTQSCPSFDEIVEALIPLQYSQPPLVVFQIGTRKVIQESQRTATHYASLFHVDYCLNKSQYTTRDLYGFLPLHFAVAMGSDTIVKELVKANPGMINDARNIRSSTPLILGVQRLRYPIVELLINLGADINCKAESIGLTPLHCAATGGPVMMGLLLKYGPNWRVELDIIPHLPETLQLIARTVLNFPSTKPLDIARHNMDGIPPEENAAVQYLLEQYDGSWLDVFLQRALQAFEQSEA